MANAQTFGEEDKAASDAGSVPTQGFVNESIQSTPPTGSEASGTGLAPNVASLLCYALTWVTGLIFLLIEKEDRVVRFHAIQAIWFGIAWTGIWFVVNMLGLFPYFGILFSMLGWLVVGVGGLIVWILLMVRAYQGNIWRLPIAGDAAARSAGL